MMVMGDDDDGGGYGDVIRMVSIKFENENQLYSIAPRGETGNAKAMMMTMMMMMLMMMVMITTITIADIVIIAI